jgi:5'-3' exonuclease
MDQWATSSSQFFAYYPKYEYLDNILSITGRKKLNLYIDVKGCAQSLFQEWAVRHILDHSKDSIMTDTSLFSSVLEFIQWHKLYAKKREIDLNFYFFMESGKSSYHLDVYKEYKAQRGVSDMFGLDLASRELFFKILDKNYNVINKVVNKLPNCNFIRLNFLEADFIPYYVMKHVLSKDNVDDAANVIYSTDKDMLQCLDATNIFQFYHHYKSVKMLSYKDIYSHWPKIELEVNDPASWFPLVLSIIGDSSDGFKGVDGIGPVKFVNIFNEIKTLVGHSMTNVYNNIANKKPIFDQNYKVANNSLKLVLRDHDIIVRNLKLSSFKILSDVVNGGFPTDMIEKKKQILENTSTDQIKCTDAGVLINALNKNGLMGVVKESVIVGLFE